jgi:hypothetical protein
VVLPLVKKVGGFVQRMEREPQRRQREQQRQDEHELRVARPRRRMIALLTLPNFFFKTY